MPACRQNKKYRVCLCVVVDDDNGRGHWSFSIGVEKNSMVDDTLHIQIRKNFEVCPTRAIVFTSIHKKKINVARVRIYMTTLIVRMARVQQKKNHDRGLRRRRRKKKANTIQDKENGPAAFFWLMLEMFYSTNETKNGKSKRRC